MLLPKLCGIFFAHVTAHCISLFVPTRIKILRNKSPWITREIIHVKIKIKGCWKANAIKPNDSRKMTLQSLSHDLKRLVKDSKHKFYNVTLNKFITEAPAKFWRYVNLPPPPSPLKKKKRNYFRQQSATSGRIQYLFFNCVYSR